MASPRVVVAGGGDAADQRPIDQRFTSWLNPRSRILYLPVAMQDPVGTFASNWAWVNQTLTPFDRTNIHMWTTLAGKTAHDLMAFDGIYIGGGNTYWLLHQLRTSGLDAALAEFIAQGGPVYGGSAGAAILGRDIDTCAHMDANIIGLTNTRGLDVLGGYAIWCHYQPEDDARIAAYVAARGLPVLALSERAGVCREGKRLSALGYEPVRRYAGTGPARQVVIPNMSIDLWQA
jgi:dipeptidase E